jgi:hypothetical protein
VSSEAQTQHKAVDEMSLRSSDATPKPDASEMGTIKALGCGRIYSEPVPWTPAFAGVTFVMEEALAIGVIPAEAGTQFTPQYVRGPLGRLLHGDRSRIDP